MVAVEALAVVQDVDQAKGKDGYHVRAQEDEEEKEVAVVPPADAVVHPGAVMVKRLHGKRTLQPQSLDQTSAQDVTKHSTRASRLY